MAILSAIISLSRLWTIRRTLASIPKGYMPLGEDELDKVGALCTHVSALTPISLPEHLPLDCLGIHEMRDDHPLLRSFR